MHLLIGILATLAIVQVNVGRGSFGVRTDRPSVMRSSNQCAACLVSCRAVSFTDEGAPHYFGLQKPRDYIGEPATIVQVTPAIEIGPWWLNRFELIDEGFHAAVVYAAA